MLGAYEAMGNWFWFGASNAPFKVPKIGDGTDEMAEVDTLARSLINLRSFNP